MRGGGGGYGNDFSNISDDSRCDGEVVMAMVPMAVIVQMVKVMVVRVMTVVG